MWVCTSCRRLLKTNARQCPADGAAAECVESLASGMRLGGYKIERVLGDGGMGFVYEATHEVLHRRTAIKMLRPELATNAQVVTRFLNEAKAVNLIDHQHIVNVYDYGDDLDGSVYFVMEYLEGETLEDLLAKRRPMQVPLLLHVFGQIAKALAAAHAKQIVHRDLKPANVYVVAREDNPYFIKLLDFGIAQLRGAGAGPALTLVGTVMGTPQFMSPEQVAGGLIDARTDVWSLGVMMYRAATGQAPFTGEEFAELAGKILHDVPPPAGSLVEMPAALSSLISSCLERGLDARCASIDEVIAGLERVKRECHLDDDAILAAVFADSGALGEVLPPAQGARTSDNVKGSLPAFQDVDHRRRLRHRPPGPHARGGRYLLLGAALIALGGGTAYGVLGRADRPRAAASGEPMGPGAATRSAAPDDGDAGAGGDGDRAATIAGLVAAGDLAAARALAQQHLRDELAATSLQRQGFAVDALAAAHVPAAAPLLYVALDGPPQLRSKAARALAELALPDAAPKLRAALTRSGDKLKVELAAALYRLGDQDARPILKRALEDQALRLTAAVAMAEVGDQAGRAVLTELLAATPAGREGWSRAAGGLARLGDAGARKLLEAERAQSAPERAVSATALLAFAGDAKAQAALARVAADPEFRRRGEAAVAMAQLGDPRALAWVGDGLASASGDERRQALTVCGLLAARPAALTHTGTIATLATDDPDPRVRLTAEAVLLGL